LDLELGSDRAKLTDAELYFAAHERDLVVLDEIHRAPQVFQTLRGVIDRRRRSGIRSRQFLIVGSASIDLLKQSAESLAGRIAYVELMPFSLQEVRTLGTEAQEKLWVRGGFPDSYLAAGEAASLEWRQAFIRTYLERDVPALGPRMPAETMYRFWQMLAHNQGQMINASRLAAGLGVSGQTVARYLDTLVDLLLVRRLPPWTGKSSKRLVRAPKVYVRDSGIVHALLGIGGLEDLLGHPVVGPSWEGMVVENLIGAAPPQSNVSFYRTSAGAEIALLLEMPGRERWAVEVKRSVGSPQPRKGFYLACEDVKATRRIVVFPGKDRYRIDGETEVLPLSAAQLELEATRAQ
jgi:predicted AAA+ superfamily ATPase